jgi:hypothetical protein
MCFGIGSGLFFGYVPFLKINGMPGTTYRIFPGMIFKRVCKQLNIKIHKESFSNELKGMDALDRSIDKGIAVGMLSSVYYLPYLPDSLRFHFNAHNLIVYGKQNGYYQVSDPVMESTTEISSKDLQRARFAKGALAPHGKMYYPLNIPQIVNLENAIKNGISRTANDMLFVPVPFFGVKGQKYLGKKIRTFVKDNGERRASLYLGNIVRMQEEIGTGGGGFRFIFAAFLQEAGNFLGKEILKDHSMEMTEIGDKWREFAYMAARICKQRANLEENYAALSEIILDCTKREKQIFKQLRKVNL